MSALRRPALRFGRRALAAGVLLALTASRALAQGAECAIATDCPTASQQSSPIHRQLWAEAAAIHEVKRRFVVAIQGFTRAQAGTFGDEGVALQAALAFLQVSLDDWDRRIAAFDGRATAAGADAEVDVVRATVFLDRHRVPDALRALERATGRAGDRVDVYTLQALAFGLAGRDADAVRALRRAVSLDPDNPVTRYGLAGGLTRLRDAGAAQAWRDVRRVLQRARTPASAAPFERVDLLGESSTAAPIFAHARYAAGFARLRTGDFAAALDAWRTAASADPLVQMDAVSRAATTRAAGSVREGDLAAARQQLDAAIAAGAGSPEIPRLLGLISGLEGADGPAIEHLRTAIRVAPGDERARLQLADALAETRRFAEAEQVLAQAVEAGLDSGLIRYRLSQLHQGQAALPQASTELQASETHGAIVGRDRLLQSIARLLVDQADFDGAVAAYTRRVDVNPNSAEAHRQLGEIYVLQGRHDEALAEFAVAVWLNPADARALAAAGQVHVRLLQYEEAIAGLRAALAADPDLLEARYALGTALLRTGKAADGRHELQLFEARQAQAAAAGQLAFELDALRREATRALAAGDAVRAVGLFEEAAAIEPESSRSQRELGVALLRARNLPEAIARLDAAALIEPSAEIYRHLADAYAAAGNEAGAARMRTLARERRRREVLQRVRELAGQR